MELSGDRSKQPFLIGSAGNSLREAFGMALVSLADTHPDFVVLDADVAGGSGTHHFRKAYPERFYQMGIAEQNMMSAAAGLAATGLVPFVTTFAVFCLRALEQARLSVAYHSLVYFSYRDYFGRGSREEHFVCIEKLSWSNVSFNHVIVKLVC